MTDVLTQLCSELAELTARNVRQDAIIEGICTALRVRNVADALEVLQELNDRSDELEDAKGAVEHRDARLAEVWELTSTGLVGCEKNSLADQVTTDVDAIVGVFGKETTDWTDLGDVKALVEEAVERLPVAADALRRYLVRQGLPADPVRLDDPDLWALYEALSDS